MSTINSKEIIDKIIAGNGIYPGDEHCSPIVRIVEYTNAWGGTCWGTETQRELGKYHPTEFVRNPKVIWERK